jgi:hypothetical protein
VLLEKKGWKGLSAEEKTAYANFRLLESGAYEHWSATEQKDFLKLVEKLKIPHPLPEPRGRIEFNEQEFEARRKKIDALSPSEYREHKIKETDLFILQSESGNFKRRVQRLKREAKEGKQPAEGPSLPELALRDGKLVILSDEEAEKLNGPITEEDNQEERKRRIRIAQLAGKKMPGIYEGDPLWDDVVPIPQDDGERPLAAIAYTDEYEEGTSTSPYPASFHRENILISTTSNLLPPGHHGQQGALSARPLPNRAHHRPQSRTLHGLALPGLDPLRVAF